MTSKSKPPAKRPQKPTGGRKAKKAAQPDTSPSAAPEATAEDIEASRSGAVMGRPPKYQDDFARQAERLCKLGATDKDLAEFFKVTTVTIWRWRSEHEEFCNALRVGKGFPDERVVRSLYQRAIGYSFDSEKIMQHNGEAVRVPYTEHVAPDPVACKMWLINRMPNEWRDKQEMNVTADEAFVNMWKLISSGSMDKNDPKA